ncbi:MAG: hypothetical protein L6R39_006247, partial [Caloplaca ligustica]
MHSFPPSNGLPSSVQLCDSINHIIEDYIHSHASPSQADIRPFHGEIQHLRKFLDLLDKVKNAGGPLLDEEESHLHDVNRLLRRCHRTLSGLHTTLKGVRHPDAHTNGHEEPWNLNTPTFTVPRSYISFYRRTLEMSLMGIHLLARCKGQLPHNNADFGWEDFVNMTNALTSSVTQRRHLTGGGHNEEFIEEMGLLRDVEQCVISAEVFANLFAPGTLQENGQLPSPNATTLQSQNPLNGASHWVADLPLPDGSRTSSSPPTSKAEDHASDDSEVESIDPEVVHEVGFSAEVYSAVLSTCMEDLRKKMDGHNYRDAEVVCKTIIKHSVDRETNLKIPFDNRDELNEMLAEICLEQKRYQKAKKILRQLLRHGPTDTDRRSRLHLLLARAHYGRKQLDKAHVLAQGSLRAREAVHGKEHQATRDSALFLITIYEDQGEHVTANALRGIYGQHPLPPLPPKSVLRRSNRRESSSPPRPSHPVPPSNHQSPPGNEGQHHHHSKGHVHWGPDVVACDASINAIMGMGQTYLIYAINMGDEEVVKLTLRRGADVERPCADTINPLMHAVALGSRNIVEILLDHNADTEVRTSGWTPLHKATQMGALAMMKLLIDAGADVEAKSPREYIQPRSKAARMKAVARDEPDHEALVLTKENSKWTPLLRAAFEGDKAAACLLLDHGANIEARDPTKATPLLWACEKLHLAIVELLLQRGAAVGATDEYGWTALHRALVNRSADQSQIISLLLSCSADINAKCSHGCTPLHYAVKNSDADAIRLLLAHKADIEARDSAELTPLHTAIDCRLEPMVRLLLERGADASAKNADGDDALAAAKNAERQSPEIIDLLRKHKKRVKRENSEAAAGKRGDKKGSFGHPRTESA